VSSDPNFYFLYSPFIAVLSFVEQDPIARQYDKTKAPTDTTVNASGVSNSQLTSQPINLYLCPSMLPPTLPPVAAYSSYALNRGNYALKAGVSAAGWTATTPAFATGLKDSFTPDDGPMVSTLFGSIRITDVTDGTSSTILAGEMHYTLKNYFYSATATSPVGAAGQPKTGDTNWVKGHPGNTDATTNVPMNTNDYYARATRPTDWWQVSGWFAFRSSHTGGCNFVFCDGSVKFLRDGISMTTYQGLGSRNGGEVLGNDY